MDNVQLMAIRRPSDMNPSSDLVVLRELDGDIIVCITKLGHDENEVQFCASGGKSPNTRRALIALMKAMNDDMNGVIPEVSLC